MATKLHELLAVNGNQQQQADKTRTDLAVTFEKKEHLFGAKIISYLEDKEGAATVTESQSDIQTTVRKELNWLSPILAKSLDVAFQVAKANTGAKADVIIEGSDTPLLRDVPVTSLMELEKRGKEFRDLVLTIPTLDPAKGFSADPNKGAGIYAARPITAKRTKKVLKVLTLAQATDKHPAQAKEYTEDDPIGTITTLEWSSKITPAEKAAMLDRADQFIRAVKQARSRANDFTVDQTVKIGDAITGFVFGQ